MRDMLKKLGPDRFEDIIAVVALYRPGPMENIPRYIEVKHGREKPDYLHPKLKSILEETYGIIIYQEQVMEIAKVLSGYSLGGADLLRRAMGKKIKAEMDAQRKFFVDGAVERGIEPGSRRSYLRSGREIRRLRLQQIACRGLCAGRLSDRLSQSELPGRIPRRVDDPRYGQHRQAQCLPPGMRAARHQGAAARHQPLRGRVLGRSRPRTARRSAMRWRRSKALVPRRCARSSPSARRTGRSRICSISRAASM